MAPILRTAGIVGKSLGDMRRTKRLRDAKLVSKIGEIFASLDG